MNLNSSQKKGATGTEPTLPGQIPFELERKKLLPRIAGQTKKLHDKKGGDHEQQK